MQMAEPTRWDAPHPGKYADRVRDGTFVDVSGMAPGWFRGQAVAVEATIFDRFVSWDGDATRRHSLHLKETRRLEALLHASGCAAISAGGCFICKAVDARGFDCIESRHVLTMSNLGSPAAPRWLIHE